MNTIASILTQAIVDKLQKDPILGGTYTDGVPDGNGLLSTYQRAPLNTKTVAVFGYDDLISTIKSKLNSWIIAAGHVADIPSTTARSKSKRARDISRDIICYNKNDPEFDQIEAIAERVYQIFDRGSLTLPTPPAGYSNWEVVKCTCNGPIIVPKEKETFYGTTEDVMIVTVNFTIQEI